MNTEIDTKNATSQLMSLQNRMEKTAQKINALHEKLRELEAPTIKTQAFTELEQSLQNAENELQKLRNEQSEWESIGVSSGGAWDTLCEKIDAAEDKVFSISSQMEKFKASGQAFINQTGTDVYQKVSNDLKNANNEMDLLKVKEQEVYDKQSNLNSKASQFSAMTKKSQDGYEKLGKSAENASNKVKKLAKESKSANKGFSNLVRTMKQMVLSMVVFQIMFKGMEFLKSGLQNLAVYSKEYNRTMSEFTSSTSQLKNAFAVAFQPILNIVIPILSQLINWISAAGNAVSRFFAILGGKSTYTKAVKQNKDYAASLEKVGSAADKSKGSLADFDELRVMQKSDASSGGSSSSDGADGSGFVDEAVGDTSKFDAIKKTLGEIVNIFKAGFTDGLGDWQSRLKDIQKSTDSIKQSLTNIFTDPAVMSGAETFAKSLIYNLGVVVGSVASIGLTIAQNLVGGIALYLEQNTERIKQYLISMFDIGTDISNLVGDFSKAFAYVFEAFGSENGKQLTANIIGIFTDAFMGASQLCWSLSRDLLNVIIQPFVENKDGFKTALEGFLGTAATVCGTIKDTIDHTFDKLMDVYNEHIKPFIDAIATGLSTLTGKFLEFWNTNVQPVMDGMAAKFDTVMKEHIQPMIDMAIGLVGSIADALKALWDQVIFPLISWIIENVLPVLLPIFTNLYNGFLTCVGFIADAITGMLQVIKGIIDFIVGVFTGDWDKAWSGISKIANGWKETIVGLIEAAIVFIQTFIVTKMEAIKTFWDTKWKAIGAILDTVWNAISDTTDKAIEGLKEAISRVLKKIETTWTKIWTSMKDTVVNIFQGIWSSIKGIINSIIGGVEKMGNGVINAINGMISALNALSFTVPDWVPEIGGKSIGFNIGKIGNISIPRLANGGITTGSTLANIGEAGREAVLPLENNTGWMDDFAEKLADKMPAGSIIQIEGDPQGMFRIVRKEADRYFRTTGKPAFE